MINECRNFKWQKKKAIETKNKIIEAAMQLAIKFGFHQLRRVNIAKHARISENCVTYHFSTMEGLRKKIIQEAKKRKIISRLNIF